MLPESDEAEAVFEHLSYDIVCAELEKSASLSSWTGRSATADALTVTEPRRTTPRSLAVAPTTVLCSAS